MLGENARQAVSDVVLSVEMGVARGCGGNGWGNALPRLGLGVKEGGSICKGFLKVLLKGEVKGREKHGLSIEPHVTLKGRS